MPYEISLKIKESSYTSRNGITLNVDIVEMTCAAIDDESSLKIAATLECQVFERQLLRVDEDEVTLAVLRLDHHIGRLGATAANRYFLVKQMLVKT